MINKWFKKSSFCFAFFILLSSFLLFVPKAHGNAIAQEKAACIGESHDSPEINSYLNTRSGNEIFNPVLLAIIATFFKISDIHFAIQKVYQELPQKDFSYNFHFHTILSSKAHPPTI